MDLTANIRKETPDDYQWVVELTERAFKTMPFTSGDNGESVASLHKSDTIHKYKTSYLS